MYNSFYLGFIGGPSFSPSNIHLEEKGHAMGDNPFSPLLIGPDGKEYPISGVTVIGRAPDCQIQIEKPGVSRHHAQLELAGEKMVIKDLESSNGTFVNGLRIQGPAELSNGDQIRIHETLLTYKAAVPAAAPAAAAPAGEAPKPAAKPAAEGGGHTQMYESLKLFTLVRSDNGAETGLSGSLKIGRDEANDISLPKDESVSGSHAKIELLKGQAVLTDLGSSNGTWVNGVRITGPVILSHGDKLRIGNTLFRLREGEKPLEPVDTTPRSRKFCLAGCGSLLGLGVIVAIVLAGASLLPTLFAVPTATPTITPTAQPTNTPEPTVIPGLAATEQAMGEEGALRSLVYVLNRLSGGAYSGSGSILDSRGYILTNFHVVGDVDTGEPYEKNEKLTIGLNWDDPTAEPDTFYQVEVVKGDPDYDLALLHVIAMKNGDPLPADLTFPTIPIGNSDLLKIGDPIAVLGYPGLGGLTPTFTRGTVAGFLADEYIDEPRGWIKTDAEVNHGNSGGIAINVKGELIGVPSMAYVDPDAAGKISGIRPINLAYVVTDAIPPK
jgi:pSer/pThr/pTyr-binding forkhead associated (FHA) protein